MNSAINPEHRERREQFDCRDASPAPRHGVGIKEPSSPGVSRSSVSSPLFFASSHKPVFFFIFSASLSRVGGTCVLYVRGASNLEVVPGNPSLVCLRRPVVRDRSRTGAVGCWTGAGGQLDVWRRIPIAVDATALRDKLWASRMDWLQLFGGADHGSRPGPVEENNVLKGVNVRGAGRCAGQKARALGCIVAPRAPTH